MYQRTPIAAHNPDATAPLDALSTWRYVETVHILMERQCMSLSPHRRSAALMGMCHVRVLAYGLPEDRGWDKLATWLRGMSRHHPPWRLGARWGM